MIRQISVHKTDNVFEKFEISLRGYHRFDLAGKGYFLVHDQLFAQCPGLQAPFIRAATNIHFIESIFIVADPVIAERGYAVGNQWCGDLCLLFFCQHRRCYISDVIYIYSECTGE
ncbi:hypothetical protein D3C72_1062890 [compost metagenome]